MFGSGSSVQLARVFGIRIGASPSWFFFLFLMIYLLSGFFGDTLDNASNGTTYLVAVIAALLFFVSLALHELGHAVVAQRNGIEVLGIDLWLLGGLAKLSRDSETPGEEFRIAAAGPAVTAAIAGLCLGGVALTSHPGEAFGVFNDDTTTPALALCGWLATVNAGLLAFNLLPAFPLDGGRIARAVVWRVTGDRHRATRLSARAGQGFAYVMIGLGIYLALIGSGDTVTGLWFILLGWFLSQGARGALVASAFSERIDGVTAADLMDAEPVAMPDGTTALAAQDEFFLRYGLPWFPVVDPAGRVLGVVRAEGVDRAVEGGRPALTAGDLLDLEASQAARVERDTPLESVLGSEPLRRLGALVVVDDDGRLIGLLTLDRVRRALAAVG
jgi:Zn-dependent protease